MDQNDITSDLRRALNVFSYQQHWYELAPKPLLLTSITILIMKAYLAVLSALVTCLHSYPWPGLRQSVPPPSLIKYDQRQEGDWNIRADLENFVILVIPAQSPSATVPSAPSMTGTLTLLDLLTKAVPWRGFKRKHINKKPQQVEDNMQLDAQQFIESKTAPYHVDISRSKTNLAKLHPTEVREDMLIAHSPKVTLFKDNQDDVDVPLLGNLKRRFSRAYVLSMPLQAEQARNRVMNYEHFKNKDGKSQEMECGPGQYKDGLGICRDNIK